MSFMAWMGAAVWCVRGRDSTVMMSVVRWLKVQAASASGAGAAAGTLDSTPAACPRRPLHPGARSPLGRAPSPCSTAKREPRGSQASCSTFSLLLGSSSMSMGMSFSLRPGEGRNDAGSEGWLSVLTVWAVGWLQHVDGDVLLAAADESGARRRLEARSACTAELQQRRSASWRLQGRAAGASAAGGQALAGWRRARSWCAA